MTDLDLDGLQEKALAATPGPWRAFTRAPYGAEIASLGPSVTVARPDDGSLIEPGDEMADAAYIVALVNAAPALIEAARTGEALKEMRTPPPLFEDGRPNPNGYEGGWHDAIEEALATALREKR